MSLCRFLWLCVFSRFRCRPPRHSTTRRHSLLRVLRFAIESPLDFLHVLVFLATVPLAWHLHEAAVDYHALFHYQIVGFEKSVEFLEQLLENILSHKLLSEKPHCVLVGNSVAAGEAEKVAEREPVANLVFRLGIAKVIHALKHQYFEHEHRVVWLGSGLCHLVFMQCLL